MIRSFACHVPFLLQEFCQSVSVDEEFRKQANAFVAGALSVCMILFCKTIWQALQVIPDNLHNNSGAARSGDNDDDDDNESWIDPWNAPIHATNRFMASLNIGELPIPFKRRQHWPWETMRRRFVAKQSEHEESDQERSTKRNGNSQHGSSSVMEGMEVTNDPSLHTAMTDNDDELSMGLVADDGKTDDEQANEWFDTAAAGDSPKKNQSICIGSIFGLDVGGTLAKLVYFEKKQPDFDPLQPNLRERHYAKAASAQAVVMARLEKEQSLGKGIQHPIMEKRKSDISTDSSSNSMSSAKHAQYMQRRRSFSISLIGRSKNHQEEEEKRLEQDRNANSHKDHQSEQDLKSLYFLRQESLPDDVRQFRHSVDFHTLGEDTYKGIFDAIGSTLDTDDENSGAVKETSIPPSFSTMSRSKSMFDMSTLNQQKAEALDRFYDFARRLGDQEDSIRDHKLSFYCRELGGEFHFIRFETRRMKNAMDLIRYNNLHLNIHEMG
jgi:hypothetical protein